MAKAPLPPVEGTWAPCDDSAPDARQSELTVVRDLDYGGDASERTGITGGGAGSAVRLPYPEATWWAKGRIGSRGFAAGSVQPTVLTAADGSAIVAADGSVIVI